MTLETITPFARHSLNVVIHGEKERR